MTTGPDRLRIALAHDYLSTIGGAERVVLSMIRAFPGAPLYTSLFEPELVDPEFRTGVDIETSSLNRFRALRRNYRIALPVMAPAISRMGPRDLEHRQEGRLLPQPAEVGVPAS
jgi:hypothetical protein